MKHLFRFLFPTLLLLTFLLLSACTTTPSVSSEPNAPPDMPISTSAATTDTTNFPTTGPLPNIHINPDATQIEGLKFPVEHSATFALFVVTNDCGPLGTLSIQSEDFSVYDSETDTWTSDYSQNHPTSSYGIHLQISVRCSATEPVTGKLTLEFYSFKESSDELPLGNFKDLYYASDGEYFALSLSSIEEAQKALQ